MRPWLCGSFGSLEFELEPGPGSQRWSSEGPEPGNLHPSHETSKLLLVFVYHHRVMGDWSFLTNHARALLIIADDSQARLRDVAAALGVTERTAYGIVVDLTEAGYVVKERDGRRNRYHIQDHLPLRDPTSRERTIGEVLDLLVEARQRNGTRSRSCLTARPYPTETRQQLTGPAVRPSLGRLRRDPRGPVHAQMTCERGRGKHDGIVSRSSGPAQAGGRRVATRDLGQGAGPTMGRSLP